MQSVFLRLTLIVSPTVSDKENADIYLVKFLNQDTSVCVVYTHVWVNIIKTKNKL